MLSVYKTFYKPREHKYSYEFNGERYGKEKWSRTIYSNLRMNISEDILMDYDEESCGLLLKRSWDKEDQVNEHARIFFIRPPYGNVRHVKSDNEKSQVSILECVKANEEYRFYKNPSCSDYVTIKKRPYEVYEFYYGEKLIAETRMYYRQGFAPTKSIYAGFDDAALPLYHILILPIYELVFEPNENEMPEEERYEQID